MTRRLCRCWWIEITPIDAETPEYIKAADDPGCAVHPPTPHKPFVEYGPSSGPTLVPKGVRLRRSRWSRFWLVIAFVNGVATGWNVADGNLLAIVIAGASFAGAIWLARLTR